MSAAAHNIQSIAVIGAGIIGLSCALELADRGLDVSLYEKNWPPRGASWAAAGMLAPAFEAAATPNTHPNLFQLCTQSAALWPEWAASLEQKSGAASGYQPGPSLAVAMTADEASHLEAMARHMAGTPSAPQSCQIRLHEIEPAIEGQLQAAWLLPSDGQVDNRLTMAALIALADDHPRIRLVSEAANFSAVDGVLDHLGHDATLICAGWGTAHIKVQDRGRTKSLVEWEPSLGEITCYGGQMLSVAPIAGAPNTTIRCGNLYIVPKADRIVIGATTEPGRVLTEAEPDIVETLRARAIEICPGLAPAEVIETWAGVRPGTKDHAPLLGATRAPNLFVASGHYRNGILLAPITAQIMGDLIVDGKTSDLAAAFAPQTRLTAPV